MTNDWGGGPSKKEPDDSEGCGEKAVVAIGLGLFLLYALSVIVYEGIKLI